jgi:hypothetical protein
MNYCLLQTDTVPLPADALKQAFRAVKGLTEADGLRAAQESWGIVRKNLTRETAAMRFQIEASNFGFKRVLGIPELDLTGKADLLVQELAHHAPHARLNQGALACRERTPTRRLYASKAALCEEEIWLLWRWQQPTTTAAAAP